MEASELHKVHTLSVASASDMRAIRVALLNYVNRVVKDEWPAMADDRPAPAAAAAFDRTSHIKWGLVLVLGAMTQVPIALVHLQRRGAQAAGADGVLDRGGDRARPDRFAGAAVRRRRAVAAGGLDEVAKLPVQPAQ